MVEAFVLVRVNPAKSNGFSSLTELTKAVEERISKLEGVRKIKFVFGNYDFVVTVKTKTLEELGIVVSDGIRTIHGVSDTETLVAGFEETLDTVA